MDVFVDNLGRDKLWHSILKVSRWINVRRYLWRLMIKQAIKKKKNYKNGKGVYKNGGN